MTTFISDCAAGKKPVASLNDGLPGDILYEFTTTAALVTADIIDLGPFPAGLTPLDVTLITDDMDTHATPTITMSVGFLNAGKTDLDGTALIVATTIPRTGGVARMATATALTGGSSTSERRMGIKVVGAVATSAGANKKLQVVVTAAG